MSKWFENSSVKMLDGSQFRNSKPWELRDDNRCAFILFFAEWCGHCQNIKPEYIEFSNIAQFMHVYAVDSDANSELMEKLGDGGAVFAETDEPAEIEGFPTIWIYKNGTPWRPYEGDHTWKAMLAEARAMCDETCECDAA